MGTSATESPPTSSIPSDLPKDERDISNYSFEANGSSQDQVNIHVVDFDGLDGPENPLNWSPTRKWCLIGLISAMTLATYA